MQNFSVSRMLRAKKTGIISSWSWQKMDEWAHETRKQIVLDLLREDKKLERWLKAFLKIYP
jgi:hypothetical protein